MTAGLLRHIERVNRWDADRFRPLLLGERRVGRIRHDFAPALAAFPAAFAVADEAVRLVPRDPEALTDAVALAGRRLVEDGLVPQWRNEWFDVTAGDDERSLFRVDRGFLPRLGIRAAGCIFTAMSGRPTASTSGSPGARPPRNSTPTSSTTWWRAASVPATDPGRRS